MHLQPIEANSESFTPLSKATILAIESSCDETSASICINGKIASNIIATQAIHEQYGGVVPELASRAHMQNILPVVDQALKKAECSLHELDAIAFTKAPGLIGALLVGAGFAKSLALALNIPLLGIHHMQAHVLSNLIEKPDISYPFLCLTVSGGHTQLVVCNSPVSLEAIGESLDDAAGETFDKTAKLLGLPYPGGPHLDRLAQLGIPKYKFAEPQIEGLNFSFSGLKTSVLYFLQSAQKNDPNFVANHLNDLCASVQHSIVNILIKKLEKASRQTKIKNVCMAGGVSANSGLRNALKIAGEKNGWQVHIPSFEYCTDNAAMIAITAYHQFINNQWNPEDIETSARAAM